MRHPEYNVFVDASGRVCSGCTRRPLAVRRRRGRVFVRFSHQGRKIDRALSVIRRECLSGVVAAPVVRDPRKTACRNCGDMFVEKAPGTSKAKRFCSPDCAGEWKKRVNALRWGLARAKCSECGECYQNPRHSRGRCRRCRTMRVEEAQRRGVERMSRRTRAVVCVVCGETFLTREGSRSAATCSKKCRAVQSAYKRLVVVSGVCKYCGLFFCRRVSRAATAEKHYCCTGCRQRDTWSKQPSRKRRRIYKQGDDISLGELIDRDNATCQLCGEKINTALPGSDPMGPTIDHVVPLSKGGGHTWDNVQLAHNRCNLKKSDSYAAAENTN